MASLISESDQVLNAENMVEILILRPLMVAHGAPHVPYLSSTSYATEYNLQVHCSTAQPL